jgi:hypothetical protein
MPLTQKQSFAKQARRKPLFFWITLLLSAMLFGLYAFSAAMIARYGALYRDFGWVVARRDGNWVVTKVTPHGPAEGKLQVGDVLLAITGDHPLIPKDASIAARRYVYVLEGMRGGQNFRLEMDSGTRRDDERPVKKLAIFAAGICFLLVGLVLRLAKPEDRLTRRASLTLLVFAGYQLYQSISSNYLLFTSWELVVFSLICVGFPFQFALVYRFYYRFPQTAPPSRYWTWAALHGHRQSQCSAGGHLNRQSTVAPIDCCRWAKLEIPPPADSLD